MAYFTNNIRSNVQVFSAILFILSLYNPLTVGMDDNVRFDVTYTPTWGGNHLTLVDALGTQVQLLLDEQSGGAGFHSKKDYGSGYFGIKMMMPNKRDSGIIVSFYLNSVPIGKAIGIQDPRDEIDIEFVGGNGKPFVLSTNVFANDTGYREQQFSLWFDPTKDFHTYEILWNQHQIVFFVDKIPIRVFPNLKAQLGVNYPTQPMHVQASIWNYSNWLGPVDWSQAPFVANYRGFGLAGCEYNPSDPQGCHSPKYFWNAQKYWQLSPAQQGILERVRKINMGYDYCADKSRHFIECKT